MEILEYSKCDCNAVTIYTDTLNYSCKPKNLKKFFPDINLKKITRYQQSYCCNHCANHYGLDLCGCGSGANFGECENNSDECRIPMQSIEEYACVRASDSWI